MKIKRYNQFIGEKIDTTGTYLQKKGSLYKESPIHRKRFGNVFGNSATISGVDWGLEFESTSSGYDIIFPSDFYKHFEKNIKSDVSEVEKKEWLKELKKDFDSSSFSIQCEESESSFNRTHFPKGIPKELQGLGLGYIIYEELIKHLGYASSKSNASDQAKKVWSKIAEDPDFLGVICGEEILVIYKDFKGGLYKPFDEIIIDYLDEKLDPLFSNDDYGDSENFSSDVELVNYFVKEIPDLEIDPIIIDEYPKVKNFLVSYFDRYKHKDKIEELNKKINNIKTELVKIFNQSPAKAKEYYLNVKDECLAHESDVKELDRRSKVLSLEMSYLDLIRHKLTELSNKLKENTQVGSDSHKGYDSVKSMIGAYKLEHGIGMDETSLDDAYQSVKDKEEEILNNLPQLSLDVERDLERVVSQVSPGIYYKSIKFINLKKKLFKDFESLSPDDIKERFKDIDKVVEVIKDLEVKPEYQITEFIKNYYPDYQSNLKSGGFDDKIKAGDYFKDQVKILEISKDIQIFDGIYNEIYNNFRWSGYQKTKELYDTLKPQISDMNYQLTFDVSWCRNTLMKYFKIDKIIKKTPSEALELLIQTMQKIEEDKKKTIEKKAYKKFTSELELAFKSGGYTSAQELYDKEIEEKASLLDIEFFDSPDYGTDVTPKTPIPLTGKEHLEKRLELYKKLGTFPKIEPVKPKVEEPEPKVDLEETEIPKDTKTRQQKTFIQKFKDFLGI